MNSMVWLHAAWKNLFLWACSKLTIFHLVGEQFKEPEDG